MWFDGSAARPDPAAQDIDAISVVGTTLYFSTADTAVPAGAGGTGDDADVYRWNGGSTYTRVVDASAAPYGLPNSGTPGDQPERGRPGLRRRDPLLPVVQHDDTTVPGLGDGVQDEDVVYFNGGTWSVYFDGTAARPDRRPTWTSTRSRSRAARRLRRRRPRPARP